MKQFKTGVVIGKFYPPHKGHHFLIQTASDQCEKLYVLVCWKKSQTVPADIRTNCIREMHPDTTVISIEDELADDDTKGWADYTVELLGFRPDAVFTSEDYGQPYAVAMGSQHVMVDRNRKTIPCSGTMIRRNPLIHLDWLSPIIRAYYVKRVCLVGAESTGKTTLAEQLAQFYMTTWVPEYGREYCAEKFSGREIINDWTSEEFTIIAQEQKKREDFCARSANKLLICDTDPLATSIWHERYLKRPSTEVIKIANAQNYDLYVLTGDEIPFTQDGTRDGEHIRHWMHQRFIEELNKSKKPWIQVSGTVEERLSIAVSAIDKILSM